MKRISNSSTGLQRTGCSRIPCTYLEGRYIVRSQNYTGKLQIMLHQNLVDHRSFMAVTNSTIIHIIKRCVVCCITKFRYQCMGVCSCSRKTSNNGPSCTAEWSLTSVPFIDSAFIAKWSPLPPYTLPVSCCFMMKQPLYMKGCLIRTCET